MAKHHTEMFDGDREIKVEEHGRPQDPLGQEIWGEALLVK